MKTALDLPDGIVQRARERAQHEGRDLSDLIVRYVEEGLTKSSKALEAPSRTRSPIPIAQAATGIPLPVLSSAAIERILIRDEIEDPGVHGPS